MFLLITTETKTIYKLPLAIVTYPEKNLIFYSNMKMEEKTKKRQKNVQEEILQEKKKDAQMTEHVDVKISMESQDNKQKDVCTAISKGQHSENLHSTKNSKTIRVELTEM